MVPIFAEEWMVIEARERAPAATPLFYQYIAHWRRYLNFKAWVTPDIAILTSPRIGIVDSHRRGAHFCNLVDGDRRREEGTRRQRHHFCNLSRAGGCISLLEGGLHLLYP